MKTLDTCHLSLLYNIWEKSFKLTKEIWYSLFMNEELKKEEVKKEFMVTVPAYCDSMKKEWEGTSHSVDAFLKGIDFKRTFPLDLVTLADKMGGYKIYYINEKTEVVNKVQGVINPKDKTILINPEYSKDKQNFLNGRYLIAKLISHHILGHTKELGWIVMKEAYRPQEDWQPNEDAARFACELIMPQEEFKRQWDSFAGDEIKLSEYFGVTQRKAVERGMYLLLGKYSNDKKER